MELMLLNFDSPQINLFLKLQFQSFSKKTHLQRLKPDSKQIYEHYLENNLNHCQDSNDMASLYRTKKTAETNRMHVFG